MFAINLVLLWVLGVTAAFLTLFDAEIPSRESITVFAISICLVTLALATFLFSNRRIFSELATGSPTRARIFELLLQTVSRKRRKQER